MRAAVPAKWTPWLGPAAALDVNCDGLADHALLAIERGSKLARGLEAPPEGRALLEWAAAAFEGGRPRPATVLVALAQAGGGFSWEEHGPGDSVLAVPLPGERACRPGLAQAVDLPWARAHGCGALAVGLDDKPASLIAFDHRSGRVVTVRDDACDE